MNGISGLQFFSRFLGLSHPIFAKNNAGKRFFEIFCYFFFNFLAGVEYERNSGLKLFSPFLTQSHPVLAKNNAEKRFFKFFEFFCYFFRNFLARVENERNSGLKFFFFSFSAYLILFWLKIIPENGFLIF